MNFLISGFFSLCMLILVLVAGSRVYVHGGKLFQGSWSDALSNLSTVSGWFLCLVVLVIMFIGAAMSDS